MESTIISAVSDDREEGEIVDDDFEDISDNSIIVPIYSGKSVSSKEHLPAISLSSVTEVDEPRCEEKIRRHQKSRRRNSKSYKKRRTSYRTSTHSDSDSDDYLELNRKLQKQLKAAIQVDNMEERHTNSLRSRLRAMTKLDHDSDNSIEKNDNNNDKVEQKVSSDEGDTELNELRLEALRTAVLNKFMHRKKRKIKHIIDNDVLSDISIKTDTSETNKENTHSTNKNINAWVEGNCPKKLCVEKPVENLENKIETTKNVAVMENNAPPEEDEDVLRALLLASMSKKITNDTGAKRTVLPSSNSNNAVKQTLPTKPLNNQIPSLSVKKAIHFKNRVVNNNTVVANNHAIQLPKIKPLIINVNADSDSDDDVKMTRNASDETVGLKPVDREIENTVEKFLKEQRAKVEAQLSPIPKPPVKITNSSVILEKSSVKLLPKVKQIEYQKLLQKLKNAEKRPRIRRSSFKINGEGKGVGVAPKKLVRTRVSVNKVTNAAPKIEQILDVRIEARTLHKTLKEMQIQRNGRLQIQDKYKVLMPIVKKINESSIERKKCDEDVKRLFQELADAKKKLLRCQQSFTAHVRELIIEKEGIDKSSRKAKVVEEPKTRFTSTPIKGQPAAESFEASSIPTTTPSQTIRISGSGDVKAAAPPVKTRTEEDAVDIPLNPGDPNDIDKIYSKQKSSIPKYISPLDNVKRVVLDDPFSILCPYDVDGNCRDPECIYKHLLK